MSILQGILDTYAQFFDLDMWIKVLQDPVSWGLISTLVVFEGFYLLITPCVSSNGKTPSGRKT